eukprot:jgi/Botrbrau1/2589/Bobra.145_1s0016.1
MAGNVHKCVQLLHSGRTVVTVLAATIDCFARLQPRNDTQVRDDAILLIQSCLSSTYKDVVLEGVRQLFLIRTKIGLSGDAGIDFLLASLSSAEPNGVEAILNGIVEMALDLPPSGLNLSLQPEGGQPPRWEAHPLSRALQAAPAESRETLLAVVSRMLARSPMAGVPRTTRGNPQDSTGPKSNELTFEAALRWLKPFLSFALVTGWTPGNRERQPFALALHGVLARVACCRPDRWAALAGFMASHVALGPVPSRNSPAVIGPLLEEVVDVVIAGHRHPAGASVALCAVGGLVQLAAELAVRQGSMTDAVRCLARINTKFPGLLASFLPSQAFLSHYAGGEEASRLLIMIHGGLHFEELSGKVQPHLSAMMVIPALQAQSQLMNNRQKGWGKGLLLRLEAQHDEAPKPPSAPQGLPPEGTGPAPSGAERYNDVLPANEIRGSSGLDRAGEPVVTPNGAVGVAVAPPVDLNVEGVQSAVKCGPAHLVGQANALLADIWDRPTPVRFPGESGRLSCEDWLQCVRRALKDHEMLRSKTASVVEGDGSDPANDSCPHP